jgi:CheY-like chemotaxis protein
LIEAADGAEALRSVTLLAPDCAIIDMNMPQMDGLELAGHLRSRFPALPISLLTANVQSFIRQRADEMHVCFFGKPLTEAIMREMLSRMDM